MPYRGFTVRYKKWSAKFDPDTIRSRFGQVSDIAKDQAQEQFANLVNNEEAVKSLLNSMGVSVMTIPFYLNVMREIYRAMTRHTDKTLANECQVIKAKWVARGLDPSVIDQIISIMVGGLPTYA